MSCQASPPPLGGPWRLTCWRALLLLLALWTAGPGTGWPAPSFLTSLPLGSALALDDNDDDDEGEDEDDDDDDLPRTPPRLSVPAPARPAGAASDLSRLGRGLRVGSVWVEKSGAQLVALRASLEWGGMIVGSLTLDPGTLEPVPFAQRGLARPRTAPTAALLRAALTRLSAQRGTRLSSGRYAAAAAAGAQLPLYWGGRHVAYVTLDARGQPRADAAVRQALSASTLKVR